MESNLRNVSRAQAVIDFIETLVCPDGALVGKPVVLRDWQKDIICSVYEPAREDGRRVVRQGVLSLGRKNGKTALIAGLCLVHLCGPEAIRNGQLYSVAFDREQAAILFKYMAAMVYMDEELSQRLNVVESRKMIIDPVSGSSFQALSSETKGKHGKSASFIVFDELAQFGCDRELYDTMMTSRGAQLEPLVWVISTQAADDKALLSEIIDDALKGEDPTIVGFLYTVPKDADPWDETNWYLANPALGDFCSLETMREEAAKAQRMPSAEASFRNLHLNQRIDAAAHFITPDVWKSNGGEPDRPLFEDAPVTGGLDLSAKNDLTALVYVAQGQDELWHVLPYFWTPGDSLRDREDRDHAPYCLWRDQGFLTAVPGKVIDYAFVAQAIKRHREYMNIVGIKFDRWRIDDLRRELDKVGVETWVDDGNNEPVPNALRLIPHGQGFKDMNPAVETVEDLLIKGKLCHGGHPVLTMCAMNARIQTDPAGGRKFDKMKSTGRIDGLVALAMALNGAVANPASSEEEISLFLDW